MNARSIGVVAMLLAVLMMEAGAVVAAEPTDQASSETPQNAGKLKLKSAPWSDHEILQYDLGFSASREAERSSIASMVAR